VTSNAKLAPELQEEPTRDRSSNVECLNLIYIEDTLDEEIAKLLQMQDQVIKKIKKILNGNNGETRTEDLKNE
jgi:hypothetical protein